MISRAPKLLEDEVVEVERFPDPVVRIFSDRQSVAGYVC